MPLPMLRPWSRRAIAIGALASLLGVARPLAAQTGVEIGQLSLEDLMNLEVTSVTKRSQRLVDAAAAVVVLTSEDIRRSGARSIPEALRYVPGVHVAAVDSNKWSVSVRGFAGRYSNKLLVLVDGRSVYAPLFSGVVWDVVNVPMDAIERIEVIRGPGATIWGANAVNGVISIVTRPATASRSVHLSAITGSEEPGSVSLTANGGAGARTALRADAGIGSHDAFSRASPATRLVDPWTSVRLGLRVDSKVSEREDLSVQSGFALSDIEDMWLTPSLAPPFGSAVAHDSRHVGGFVSGRWSRRDDGGETALRLVAERSLFSELLVEEHRTTFDFDIQRTQHLGEAHEFVGGLSYRRSADDILGTSLFSATPGARTLQWQSGFAQDEVRIRERLRVTVGAKVEHNDYTGWEFQPNVRGVFGLSPSQSVWAAVSRAVRLPSRAEADGAVWVATFATPGVPLPQAVRFTGAGLLADSEVLAAREVGYRYRLGEQVSVDVTAFHNRYDGLIQLAVLDAPTLEMAPQPHVTVPMQFSNSGRATRSGAEVASEWRPTLRLRLNGAYSWLRGGEASPLQPGFPVTDDAPERQSYLRAAISLPARLELDAAVRYVSALRATSVPSYITGDARIGFRLWRMNASVVGRNLMSPRHVEYVPELFALGRSAVERSVTFQVRVAR